MSVTRQTFTLVGPKLSDSYLLQNDEHVITDTLAIILNVPTPRLETQ